MPIYRMFDSAAAATEAAETLEQEGFSAHHRVVSGHVDTAEVSQLGFGHDEAERLAERITGGAALVVVNPPFGLAIRATRILQGAQGGDQEVIAAAPAATPGTPVFDNAAPLSSKLNWPVLLHDPTPLSTYLKLPVLSRRQNPKSAVPLLSRDAAPLSSKVGMKTLTANAAPLSSLLGVKVLIDNPTPLSSKLNIRVLTGR